MGRNNREMKVQDIINRLKDTRGFINLEIEQVDDDENALSSFKYMLEGIEEAIKLIQDSK